MRPSAADEGTPPLGITAEQDLGRVTLIERQRDHRESEAVSDARIPRRPIPSFPFIAGVDHTPGAAANKTRFAGQVVQRSGTTAGYPTKQQHSRRKANSLLIVACCFLRRVSEGTRTPDRLDHNQELYQLSYAHRDGTESTSRLAPGPRGASDRQALYVTWMPPAGFEPATIGLEVRRSVHLSYEGLRRL